MIITENMACPICIAKCRAPYEAPLYTSKHIYTTLSKSLDKVYHPEFLLHIGLRRPRTWKLDRNPREALNATATYMGRTSHEDIKKTGVLQHGELWNPSTLFKSLVENPEQGRATVEYSKSDGVETVHITSITGDLDLILVQTEPYSRQYTMKAAGEAKTDFAFDAEFTRFLKAADDRFTIAGYASPRLVDSETGYELPDMDGDSVDLKGIDDAFRRMMSIHSRRNLMGYHSNIQIGEIVWNGTDSEGKTWKSHTVFAPDNQYPKQGLFVVADIFGDTATANRYRRAMKLGNMLKFSISGEALRTQKICEGGICRNHIMVMDLAEISACEKGKNPEADAFILKAQAAQQLAHAKDGASFLKQLMSERSRKKHE